MADTQEIKLIGFDQFTLYDSLIKAYVDGKIFVGTTAEYQTAYANGDIKVGALVCIIDDENSGSSGGSTSGSSTSAVLGEAKLGYMILG